jgi:hypothetical protein
MKLELVLDTKSVNRFIGNLRQKHTRVRSASRQTVNNTGDKIFQKAQGLVPVMTGALQASGKVTRTGDTDNPENIISYGDSTIGHEGRPTSAYAVARHEMMSRINPDAYKWLEKTLLAADEDFRNEALRLLGEAIRG